MGVARGVFPSRNLPQEPVHGNDQAGKQEPTHSPQAGGYNFYAAKLSQSIVLKFTVVSGYECSTSVEHKNKHRERNQCRYLLGCLEQAKEERQKDNKAAQKSPQEEAHLQKRPIKFPASSPLNNIVVFQQSIPKKATGIMAIRN